MPWVYALLVNCYRNLELPHVAEDWCRQGLEKFPLDAELRFYQGNLHHEAGRLAKAVQCFQHLLEVKEEKPGVNSNREGARVFRLFWRIGRELSELDGISCNSERHVVTRITRVFSRKTPTFRIKLSGSSVNPKSPNFETESKVPGRDSNYAQSSYQALVEIP